MTAAAIYARYSSDLQRDASIEDQIRLCKERAKREGWRTVNCYTDHAISGASLIRPGMQMLLQDAQAGKFDVIVAEAIDRLSRDQEDIAHIYKRARFANVRIVTLSEGDVNELHIGLKGTMGALFLKDLADKTRRGLRGRVEAGKSGGGNSFGYDVVRRLDDEGLPVRGERKINAAQAGIVRRIFNDYASGKAPQAIAKQLNKEAVAGPSGTAWGPSTIHGNPDRGTGILNNELYIGKLVWNRLRYIKDPETGKRVSRPNPESVWITQDVPELRIVSEDLWQAVKTRQKSLRATRSGKKQGGYWDRRRPHYLFSGLMRCGCCGGGFVVLNAERIGCANARNKGTCDNRHTIRRDALEVTVLEGLQSRLMDPALCDEFCKEYTRHMNRLRGEGNAQHKVDKSALAKIERELDRLVKAIMDGVPASRVKDKMAELESNRAEIEARLKDAAENPVLIHPNMANHYRDQIASLREALSDEHAQAQASDLIRKLIDKIVLVPGTDNEGRTSLSIDLHGHLAGILSLATKAKGPLGESGPEVGYTKLVAGKRNQRYCGLNSARVPRLMPL
jgi:site-specific DNA recombinase